MNSGGKRIQRSMGSQQEITGKGLTRRDWLQMGKLSASTSPLLTVPGNDPQCYGHGAGTLADRAQVRKEVRELIQPGKGV